MWCSTTPPCAVARRYMKKTIAADGCWGLFRTEQGSYYEFVVRANGYAITHIYRSPLARDTNHLNLQAMRFADADLPGASVVHLVRPPGLPRPHGAFRAL